MYICGFFPIDEKHLEPIADTTADMEAVIIAALSWRYYIFKTPLCQIV